MTGKNLLWAAEQSGHSVEMMLRMYAKWPASPMNLPPDLPPHCHQRMTVVTNGALSGCPRGKKSGGEGGIRTHVPELPDHPISSRRRYDHFGTSPFNQKFARF
jgi:hypothetical protein